jgi:hypothetical protein
LMYRTRSGRTATPATTTTTAIAPITKYRMWAPDIPSMVIYKLVAR